MNDGRPVPGASRFRALSVAAAVFVVVAACLRAALFLKSRGEAQLGFGRLPLELGVGLVYDLAAFAYGAVPVVLYVALAPARVWRSGIHSRIAFVLWCVFVYAVCLEALAEWYFWDEFGARFNFVAVDYLVYTGEVLGNIRESYPVEWVLPALLIPAGLVVFVTWRRLAPALAADEALPRRALRGAAWLAAPAVAWFALGDGLAHVGDNRYENEIALNGLYAFGTAFWKNTLAYDEFYAMRDRGAVYARLREMLSRDGSTPASPAPYDLVRHVTNDGPEKRFNVVLITVESLSARYMGFSGSELSKSHVTPRLDAIAEESLLFTRMYSTGTRTVRGLEALTLSIPPTPGQSTVKRPGNENLFSAGFLFRGRGYETKFVYGGYGLFDNMNRFYADNGFTAVDRTDLADDERTFGNVWGVCDEDLFRRVGREADASHAAGRPFLLHVMTTSNHQPYTYPGGRISIPSGTGRSGAAKYTDYAIGKFIDDSRGRPWFDDTIFIVVGDHTDNGRGFTELTVDRFHIGCLVYAPKIVKAARFDGVCSQVDVTPTLLGILRWSYDSKFLGQDVLRRPPDRALLCNYLHVGLYDGHRLVTLGPHRDVQVDDIDATWHAHRVDPPDAADVLDCIAYYQGASDALQHGLFGRIAAARQR